MLRTNDPAQTQSPALPSPLGDGPDLTDAALDRLIQHHNFYPAVMALAANAVEQYSGNWVLNRLMSDRGRIIAGYMTLFLYHDSDGAGFTIGQFRDAATRLGFASPGRVTAWAATMRLLGFFTPVGSGRPQRVIPTEKFFIMFRARARSG